MLEICADPYCVREELHFSFCSSLPAWKRFPQFSRCTCSLLSGHQAPFVGHDHRYLHFLCQCIALITRDSWACVWTWGGCIFKRTPQKWTLDTEPQHVPFHKMLSITRGAHITQNSEKFNWVIFKVCKVGMKFQSSSPIFHSTDDHSCLIG